MDLSKYNIVPVYRKVPYPTFLFFGPAKTGKTSAALTFPRPLVFDWDKGAYELGVLPSELGRRDAARGFPVLDVNGDISIFMNVFEQMKDDGFFNEQHPEVESLIFDTSTRIYDALKMEYLEEKNVQTESIFDGAKIRLDEYGKIKTPLKNMMTTLIHAPYIKVHIMQESVVFKKNAKGQLEASDTTTFKGEASIVYDASVVVRTFVEDGIYKGEVVYDRTHVYKSGDIITEPGWAHWRDFYRNQQSENGTMPSIRMAATQGRPSAAEKIAVLLADPEIIALFEASGIPRDKWEASCKKYNGDRNLIVAKLKEKIGEISNQSI